MKKKLLSILLLVVIVFNFILCNSVYADPGESPSTITRYGGNAILDGKDVLDVSETGRDSQGKEFKDTKHGVSIIGVLMQYVASTINSFPITIQGIITLLSITPTGGGFIDATVQISEAIIDPDHHFTIEKAVFNEIALFNINVFNQDASYTNGIGGSAETFEQHTANLKIKESTTSWFYTCRLLAMMINLCVLIYVGIRMALSTIAAEEAKYKKMLISWVESMAVLFILHYVMIIIVSLGESVLNILSSIRYNMIASGEEGFEEIIMQKIYTALNEEGGIQLFMYSVFFWFLTFIQLKFFFTYFKRLLTIMFLTIIGPFITVTYPIDKMGDGKAQAFESWMNEFIINIAIQPIHAAIYIVFVYTAGKIAEQAPFVAMIFLLTLGTIEKMVRNLFGIKSASLKDVDEGFGKKKK